MDFNFNSNHIEGNTLTYGQTELLLLFGKVVGEAEMKDLEEMKASNVGLKMMQEQAGIKDMPLTQNFIRQLHKTLLREQLGINKSAVQRLLARLKEKGYIEARDNEGGWRVLITPSM